MKTKDLNSILFASLFIIYGYLHLLHESYNLNLSYNFHVIFLLVHFFLFFNILILTLDEKTKINALYWFYYLVGIFIIIVLFRMLFYYIIYKFNCNTIFNNIPLLILFSWFFLNPLKKIYKNFIVVEKINALNYNSTMLLWFINIENKIHCNLKNPELAVEVLSQFYDKAKLDNTELIHWSRQIKQLNNIFYHRENSKEAPEVVVFWNRVNLSFCNKYNFKDASGNIKILHLVREEFASLALKNHLDFFHLNYLRVRHKSLVEPLTPDFLSYPGSGCFWSPYPKKLTFWDLKSLYNIKGKLNLKALEYKKDGSSQILIHDALASIEEIAKNESLHFETGAHVLCSKSQKIFVKQLSEDLKESFIEPITNTIIKLIS